VWRRWKCELWGGAATFISTRQAHSPLQVLRVVELDIYPDVLRQSTHEQLCLLVWCEASSMRQACHERLQIRGYVRGEGQTRQFRQMVVSGGPKR
jgi:hypothetical protein